MEEKILLLVWVMQSKSRKNEREKVDEHPGTELWKGKYIHSTLRFELFHSQVPLLMGRMIRRHAQKAKNFC